MEKKFLILGASGQLGSEFRQALSQQRANYIAPDEKSADLTNHQSIKALIRNEMPDVVINCAAYNAVDDAEINQELAFRINSDAVAALAETCRSHNAFLVHYSSDYVFDGKKGDLYIEEDEAAPLNIYGKSKLAGEKAVLDILPESLVFRLSWVIGKGKQNFLFKLTQWAMKNQILKISADETSVPTFTDDIVRVTLSALQKNLHGLFHLTSSDYASRYELSRYFLKKANLKNIVVPVPVSYFQTLAERPVFSAMSNKKIAEATGIELPDWREGVERYLHYFFFNS